ncbi:hypothetical protein [Aquimarina sp. AU474]|uniref:hypothetical protein n=1 Tax=Aquimarina sp. AU474 TaxID=2108529 RepID=UPI000D69D930|nr:hypothetical protein [Aquimarina sp. AU474]
MRKVLNIIIILLSIIGIMGAGSLVIEEIQTGNGCPKLWIIPFCLIILICFVVPLFVHVLKKWNVLYFLFTGLAGIIALIASIMQFIGTGECPKTNSGIPMCYFSLLLFASLIISKAYLLRKNISNRSY